MKNLDLEITQSKVEAMFKGLQCVEVFINERQHTIFGVLSRNTHKLRDDAIKGLWCRNAAWMKSLTKLDGTIDYQAYSIACRGLLETLVDMILLHSDKTNESGEKMYWWSQSEKLKDAELIIEFCKKNAIQISDEYEVLENFIKNNKSKIEQKRNSIWKVNNHPKGRWTSNSDLSRDVIIADGIFRTELVKVLNMSLEQFYQTQYRKINWHIHSGLSSFWDLSYEAFEVVAFLLLKYCADLSILCTKVIFKDFGLNEQLNNLEEVWRFIGGMRNQLLAESLEVL